MRNSRHSIVCSIIILAVVGCQKSNRVDPLGYAPGAQIIGSTWDGGGISRAVATTMVLAGLAAETAAPESAPGAVQLFKLPASDAPVVHDFGEVPAGECPEEGNPRGVEFKQEDLAQAQRVRIGDYKISIWPHDDTASFAIHHRGDLVYLRTAGHFALTSRLAPANDYDVFRGPNPGEDIDGDGVPDLLVYFYSGGLHCCHDVLHFTLGERPGLRALIAGWHSKPKYTDLDGDGRPEIRMRDTSFAYWNACYMESPSPTVILRIRGGRYEMAAELMRREGPTPAELADRTREERKYLARLHEILDAVERGIEPPANDPIGADLPIQAWRSGRGVTIPPGIWGVMLDLIYSDRVAEAAVFLNAVWPAGRHGREEFLGEIAGLVLSSWFGQRLPWATQLQSSEWGGPAPAARIRHTPGRGNTALRP